MIISLPEVANFVVASGNFDLNAILFSVFFENLWLVAIPYPNQKNLRNFPL